MPGGEVFVTGIGVVSPFGVGPGAFRRGLMEGRCAVRPVEEEAEAPMWRAPVGEFSPAAYIRSKTLKYVGPATQMLCVAVKLALVDAGLVPDEHEVSMVIGTAMGNLPQTVSYTRRIMEGAPSRLSPMMGFDAAQNSAVSFASAVCQIRGCVRTVATGWTSSGHALEIAARMIRLGLARVVVAGGVEQASPLLAEMYRAQGVCLGRRCLTPFDRRREGLCFGEGAYVMVLETGNTMEERKARPYGRLAGFASSASCNPSAPVEGRAAVMRRALAAAGADSKKVDAVSASANSTPRGDLIEGRAIREVCGDAVRVTAIKSMIGESCGAAAAAQALQSLLSVQHGEISPVACLRELDPAVGLKRVLMRAEQGRFRRILVNSADPAGGSCSLVVTAATVN